MKGIVEGSPLSHLGSSSPYFTEPVFFQKLSFSIVFFTGSFNRGEIKA
jgi:hypothetical protein